MKWLFGYLVRIATWLSQGANVIVFNGEPDLTVSARCHVLQHRKWWGWGRRVINTLFFWQEDHCRESFQLDIKYAYWVYRSKGWPCDHHVTKQGVK